MRTVGFVTRLNETLIKGTAIQPNQLEVHISPWSFGSDRRYMIVGWRPDKQIWDFVTQRSHGGKGIARPQLSHVLASYGPQTSDGFSIGITRLLPCNNGDWRISHKAIEHGADVYFEITYGTRNQFAAQLWDDTVQVRELSAEASHYFSDLLQSDDNYGPFKLVDLGRVQPLNPRTSGFNIFGETQSRYGLKTDSCADKYIMHAIFMPSVKEIAKMAGLDPESAAQRFRANIVIDGDFEPFIEDSVSEIRLDRGLNLKVVGQTKRCSFVNLDQCGENDLGHNVLGHLARFRQSQGHKGAPTFGVHLVVDGNEQDIIRPGTRTDLNFET